LTPTETTLDRFELLATRLEQRLDPLAASVLERVREKHPTLASRKGVDWNRLAELTAASLRVELRSFRAGRFPERCPEIDAAGALALARQVGIGVLLDGYRFCQLTLWRAWFELIEDSRGLSVERRRDLLSRGSDFFFRYADLLCGYVAEVYERALGRPSQSASERRREAVRGLLSGDPLAASWLDFDVERHHLGLIAWGEGAAGAARGLASALARPLLVVPVPGPGDCCWAWISGSRSLGPGEQRAVAQFSPADARLALGLEAFGVEGFRSTHRQAMRAMRFSGPGGSPLVRYEDVVVEALACENEDDARAFVAHELRGIDDDSPRSGEIRETLAAYFAAGCNAASAGAHLGVHQQTVANRLRAAEQRLGAASVGVRRIELEMALRLRECLAASTTI
jgi:hypothetical protein